MQSNNPVFKRNDGFNGRGTTTTAPPAGGYTDPSTWQTGASQSGTPVGGGYGAHPAAVDQGRMTLDSVVQKTAFTLFLVFVSAGVSWYVIGDMFGTDGLISDESLVKAGGLATGGAIIGFALAMVNSFKKVISPALVMAYALVEGVFVGAFSKVISAYVGDDPTIVLQAVLGTFAAFGATLAVYKFFNIKVTDKFRRGFTAALFGFAGLLLLNWILSFFNADFGLRDMSGLGLIISVVAVIFGVVCLIMDFDFVERGIAAGLPERESWRAAFGLTVTLIWLYLEILRILAILRGSE